VIGLAADKSIADRLADAPGVPAALFYRTIYRKGESGAPIMDPDMSWGEVRAAATRLLPGVRYRRHLLWRYSLLWRKPRARLPGADPLTNQHRLRRPPGGRRRMVPVNDPRRPASSRPPGTVRHGASFGGAICLGPGRPGFARVPLAYGSAGPPVASD
jgi:hypothetical protein